MQLFNSCEDSLLATPLIIDLAILAELMTRITYRKADSESFEPLYPVLSLLSYMVSPSCSSPASQSRCKGTVAEPCSLPPTSLPPAQGSSRQGRNRRRELPLPTKDRPRDLPQGRDRTRALARSSPREQGLVDVSVFPFPLPCPQLARLSSFTFLVPSIALASRSAIFPFFLTRFFRATPQRRTSLLDRTISCAFSKLCSRPSG
jgi:hypothetical protein